MSPMKEQPTDTQFTETKKLDMFNTLTFKDDMILQKYKEKFWKVVVEKHGKNQLDS